MRRCAIWTACSVVAAALVLSLQAALAAAQLGNTSRTIQHGVRSPVSAFRRPAWVCACWATGALLSKCKVWATWCANVHRFTKNGSLPHRWYRHLVAEPRQVHAML